MYTSACRSRRPFERTSWILPNRPRQWVERARADRRPTGLTTGEREELARESHLAEERDGLKKATACEAEPVRFRFIAVEKARHRHHSGRCLAVTRSGFYAWQRRLESARSRDDRRLKVLVKRPVTRANSVWQPAHSRRPDRSGRAGESQTGRPADAGRRPGRTGLRKRYKVTTMSDHDQPVAAICSTASSKRTPRISVGRRHDRVRHRQRLYLAAVLDLFSRFIVGWAVSAVNDRHVTIKALMALKRRCPDIGLSIIPIRVVRTQARIIATSSRRVASSAA